MSESVSHAVVSDALRPHGLQLARILCPWNSPGKNTGVGCRSLLQGIFPTQGLNLGLPHCRQILYLLNGPSGVEWVKGCIEGGRSVLLPPSCPPHGTEHCLCQAELVLREFISTGVSGKQAGHSMCPLFSPSWLRAPHGADASGTERMWG